MQRYGYRSWTTSTQGGGTASQPVAWHEPLYVAMALYIWYDVNEAKRNKREMPYVLVLGCLTCTVAPLEDFLSWLFEGDGVQMATVDSSRGRTASIVHFAKHRRTVGEVATVFLSRT